MSMTSVLRSATARHAPRFIAVVVLPTPPFWLAIAMIRPTCPSRSGELPRGRNITRAQLSSPANAEEMFHVEQRLCSTWSRDALAALVEANGYDEILDVAR